VLGQLGQQLVSPAAGLVGLTVGQQDAGVEA
jgi:hypothetical protein